MTNRVRRIAELGQAIWLDFISRDLLRQGELRALIESGVSGMTSNPTIFQKAIASGTSYDASLRELAREGLSALEIYERLAIQDITEAADQLRTVYNETHGRDGYVSIEVNPRLAHDTEGTVAEARRLHAAIGRPNVMIKVPATEAGLPAIRALIGEAINVNVTLICAIEMYERVIQAYLEGLRALREQGRPIGLVASVASFFVSRVDTLLDPQLTQRVQAGETSLAILRGQAAIANARIAYDVYQSMFEGPGFAELRAAGARVQRPLWASTSTKNPDYPSTKYVDALIGPNTVNTVPPQTLEAIQQHSTPARTIDLDTDQAYALLERLAAAGIDFRAVTDELLLDGVRQFADSFEKLLADVETKRRRFAGA